ncbi:hypothetical protein ACWXVJ_00655 [Mycoplasma sp. 773]
MEKKIWITYTTLNVALLLIFSSMSFFDYSLLLGYLVGIVSFLLFLLSVYVILKIVKNSINVQGKKHYKIRMLISVLIFFALNIFNGAIFAIFIYINTYLHKDYPGLNAAFFPFNTITMTAPYILLSIFSIVWAVVTMVNKRKELNG